MTDPDPAATDPGSAVPPPAPAEPVAISEETIVTTNYSPQRLYLISAVIGTVLLLLFCVGATNLVRSFSPANRPIVVSVPTPTINPPPVVPTLPPSSPTPAPSPSNTASTGTSPAPGTSSTPSTPSDGGNPTTAPTPDTETPPPIYLPPGARRLTITDMTNACANTYGPRSRAGILRDPNVWPSWWVKCDDDSAKGLNLDDYCRTIPGMSASYNPYYQAPESDALHPYQWWYCIPQPPAGLS